jgi:hypothetical protein
MLLAEMVFKQAAMQCRTAYQSSPKREPTNMANKFSATGSGENWPSRYRDELSAGHFEVKGLNVLLYCHQPCQ